MRILLTGLPGSGKTTQAKKISEYLNFCYVGVGDVLRSYANENQEVKEALEKGEMVDDKLVAELVKQRLSAPDCDGGVVVDGYPRHIEQVEVFDPKYEKIFYLKISEKMAKKRLLSRGRKDDIEEVVNHRIKLQDEFFKTLLPYFKESSNLIEIDGEKSIDEVFDLIKESLDVTKS